MRLTARPPAGADDTGVAVVAVARGGYRWECRRLIIGTGAYGALPVMEEVKLEARRRKVDLVILPTDRAVDHLIRSRDDSNAILHVTC